MVSNGAFLEGKGLKRIVQIVFIATQTRRTHAVDIYPVFDITNDLPTVDKSSKPLWLLLSS